MATAILKPLPENQRIQLLDALRGFALLGILLMNIMSQGQSHFFYDALDLRQSITGANYWAWYIECFFFEGTMRGIFSILFGAGMILLVTRLEKKNTGLEPADIYYRRLFWLLLFGLFNAFILLWPGDILFFYALGGLFLFPFRNWTARNLFIAAFVCLLIGMYRNNADLYDSKSTITKGLAAEQLASAKATLSDVQKEDLKKFQAFKEDNTKEGIARRAVKEEKQLRGQSYAALYKYYRDINMRRESLGFYNFAVWDVLIFFFLGMALFKARFFTGTYSNLLYGSIALVGLGVAFFMNYSELNMQYQLRFDSYLIRQKQFADLYEFRRVVQTMGYLSTLILLYKWIPFKKIFSVFAPVGQMAFTNYLSQSLITSIIFYGFGLFGKLQRYEIYYVLFSIWAFQIAFSHIWLHYFRFGPFEWLWRSLTYWKKQPMKRHVTTEETDGEQTIDPLPSLA